MITPGSWIGPFRVTGQLAASPTGAVVRAWDPRLERAVAIKCLAAAVTEHGAERLRREARALAALDHPSIVTIHDIVIEDGRDCLVMELLDGPTLAERLATHPMSRTEVLSTVATIADALAAAHAIGIVHRDLKLDNVVMTSTGLRVIDFGLARRAEESRLTADGVVVGTCRAMSPEQARGEPTHSSTDVFALGSLAYELLSGAHPFAVDDPFETMRRIAEERPQPLHHVVPELDATVVGLVHRMLDPHPERRPSARDVASALIAPPSNQPMPPSRSSWRLRALGLGAVVALAVVSGLLGPLARRPATGRHIAVRPAFELRAEAVRAGLVAAVASGRHVSVADTAHLASLAWAAPEQLLRAVAADGLLEVADTANGVVVWRFEAGDGLVPVAPPVAVTEQLEGAWRSGFRIGRALVPDGPPAPDAADLEDDSIASVLSIERQVRLGSSRVEGDLLDRLEEAHRQSPGLVSAALLASELAHALWTLDPTRTELLQRSFAALERAEACTPADNRYHVRRLQLEVASAGHAEPTTVARARRRIPAHPSTWLWASVYGGSLPSPPAKPLQIDRLSAPGLLALARAERASGLHDRATTHHAQAVDRGGYSPVPLAAAARLELDRGDPADAAAWLVKLRRRIRHPAVDLHLGIAELLQGRLAAGCRVLERAAETTGDPVVTAWQRECCTSTSRPVHHSATVPDVELPPVNAPATVQIAFLWTHARLHQPPSEAAGRLLLRLHADPPTTLQTRVLLATADAAMGYPELARATLAGARADGASRHWSRLPWFRDLEPSVVRAAADPVQ